MPRDPETDWYVNIATHLISDLMLICPDPNDPARTPADADAMRLNGALRAALHTAVESITERPSPDLPDPFSAGLAMGEATGARRFIAAIVSVLDQAAWAAHASLYLPQPPPQ